jgi:hypothetical protein
VTPEELAVLLARGGLDLRQVAGMQYTPPLSLMPGGRGLATGGTWQGLTLVLF